MSLACRDCMSIKRLSCLAFAAAIGCQAPGGDESHSTATSLVVASSTVQQGRFEQPDLTPCCTGDQSCSGTNPSSPYSRVRLPPAPGQTVPNPNADPDGTATSWRLRQDEAVVVVGNTPPSARYYGFTPYLSDRYDPTIDARRPLFASLGDTWNQLVLATGGPTPFESPFAIIFTSNATTAQLTSLAFANSGVAAINVVVLPAATTVLGIDDHADTFSFFLRVGVPDDPAALDAWLANPPAVYRVTPRSELAANPLPVPASRPRGTGVAENLSSAVNALGLAIRSRAGGTTIATQNVDPAQFNGDACIANNQFCAGDNRDALYGSSRGTFDLDAPGRYVMVYGVNHAATGKASYSNASIVYNANALGVVAVDSTMMAGSAAVFLPNHPARDSLYAFAFARDCSVAPTPFCITVPSDGCPVLPIGEAANLTLRAYLEPATATGPAYNELVVDRALLVN
jgi:hypothetical protein